MNYKRFLIDACLRMVKSGLTVETWGNISVRDPETGYVYLTPSGMPYDTLVDDDIVVMDIDGNRIEGERKPTIEYAMHLGIMKNRPDVNAVVHTHPVYSQIFALLHENIPPVIDEAAQTLGNVPVTEYALPGSKEMAENAIAAIGKEGAACLLANHGAVAVGKDMDTAFKVCTILEMTSQIYYMARCIGTPKTIDDDKIAYMQDFVRNSYGQR
ncbi:MAG: class II aldolase/adducin family protein [Oscillospiraceae bacterium]|nr:class II aldolase/adducin family protein [Oscillospiraceae bacterium]MBQ2794833.1 class II aldolase/adducin family protein [Oscillospiraceae bacterium]MBQ2998664.1 class II aldolase/adducin family protein [Oscillospiraceae bacterium]MBQ3237402.1 class II aldolase/adducin family protein [Oscillospiraceae bacterium]MBQ3560650.1 class II aldolase/adducin family protein [Oscillospiraceae bacterium]